MLKKYCSLLCFLLMLSFGFSKTKDTIPFKTAIIVKLNPMSVFEHKPTFFDASVEVVLKRNFAVEQSVGILNAYTSIYRKDNSFVPNTLIGIESKTTLKYYFKNYSPEKWWRSVYLAPEIEYAFYKFSNEQSYCRYGCSYLEEIKSVYATNEIAVSLKFGKMYFFGKNKRCVIDVYGGFGYKFIRRATNPLPPDINDNNTISFERRGFLSGLQDYYGYGKMGNYHMFKTVFGFRIGYRVR
jgi:hypothetical protein